MLPIFEKIGSVFLFARHEFATKIETVVAVTPKCPTLDQIVAAGKADGTITKKNSPARNVHRLLNTLNFIAAIFENLAKGHALKVGRGQQREGARGWLLARRRGVA